MRDLPRGGRVYERHRKTTRLVSVSFGGAVMILIIAGIFYALRRWEILAVKTFTVFGNRLVEREEILSATQAELALTPLGKLLGRENILLWKTIPKQEKTFSHPRIAAVTVDTNLFLRHVTLAVRERELFGIWCISGECYGFDRAGIAFLSAPRPEGFLIFQVDDENTRPVSLGGSLFPGEVTRDVFFRVLDLLQREGVQPVGARILPYSLREWEVTLREGTKLALSTHFIPQGLGRILKTVMQSEEKEKVHTIDFRVPNRVYYR